MRTKAIPEGFHSLIPDLVVRDVAPEMNAFSPQSPGGGTSSSMFLYVDDVDSVFTKAVSAGAKVTMPLKGQETLIFLSRRFSSFIN